MKTRILKIEIYIESEWTASETENAIDEILNDAFPESTLIRDIVVEEQ